MGDRLDLRKLPLVTIDGEDARDFDDAVFAEPDPDHPGGWRLLVAIADVAWYVRPEKPLDRAAYRRGTSVYFPDRVVPMLPEALSNNWCSLLPRQDRPVLVAEMWIDADGALKKHRFHRAMMHSAARLTYNRLQKAKDGVPDDELAPLMDSVVKPLYGAFATLLAAREKRGALDLDLPERLVRLGDDGRIADIGVRERLDSHRLIEEFMVLANVAAAQALEQRHLPCLYRVHDQPDAAKLEALREFLGTLGISVPVGQRLRPGDLNRVLHAIEGKPTARLVNETILRSQSQAVYSPEQPRPFRTGAGALRPLHLADPPLPGPDRPSRADLGLWAGRRRPASTRTRAASRSSASICRCASAAPSPPSARQWTATSRPIMADHVGATFSGRVTSVTRFGLFMALDGTGADGLIPIRSLGQEFFRHDEGRQMLVGERTGETYGLGDRLKVKLDQADTATGGLLFDVVEVIERVERQAPSRSHRLSEGHRPRRPVAHGKGSRDKRSRRRN